MSDERFRKAEFAAWVGIVGNIVLAILKGGIGFYANSRALIADAAHSASDVLGSIAVLVGLKAAKKPPDEDHPYGHGKAETIAAIIVSILMFLVAFEIGTGSFQALFEPLEAPLSIAIWAVAISIVVKEAMYRYKYNLGKKIGSQALIANALEHRSDVFSSIAALVGIGGAVIGQWLGISWLVYLDPIAGIFVAGIILKMGYQMLRESIHYTLDHVLHQDEATELVDAVKSVPGVIMVDELRAREHGHYWIVDVKISVDPKITVLEGHGIAKAAKQRLMTFQKVSDALIHVNPYDPGFAYSMDTSGQSGESTRFFH
jgi:cation diffusion facilitator family transporter